MSGFFRRSAHSSLAHDITQSSLAESAAVEEQTRIGGSFYVMESTHEGARLEAKTDSAASEAQLRMTGLGPGKSAVDVGCGTGAVTRTIARVAAPGSVVGVDMSPLRLEEARALAASEGIAVEFREGKADELPLADNGFDYSWSRFLFEYLPNPQQALAEMVRVTRPGGTVVVADLDGQIEQFYPLEPKDRANLDEALRLLGKKGFDPWIGRKLYSWFCQVGLQDIVVHVAPYQVYAGGMPARDLLNWREKFVTSAEQLAKITGEKDKWAQFRDKMLAYIEQPQMFYYCTLIVVQGTKERSPA